MTRAYRAFEPERGVDEVGRCERAVAARGRGDRRGGGGGGGGVFGDAPLPWVVVAAGIAAAVVVGMVAGWFKWSAAFELNHEGTKPRRKAGGEGKCVMCIATDEDG